MPTLTIDRMTVDAALPHADPALIDRLQTALQRWSDHSRLAAPDHLVARIIPALTLDLGSLSEQQLLDQLGPRLDKALAEALARLVTSPAAPGHREELARWLRHGTPLWTRPDLGHTALGALLYAEVRRADGIAWLMPLLARQAARARLLRLPAPLLHALLDWLEDSLPAGQTMTHMVAIAGKLDGQTQPSSPRHLVGQGLSSDAQTAVMMAVNSDEAASGPDTTVPAMWPWQDTSAKTRPATVSPAGHIAGDGVATPSRQHTMPHPPGRHDEIANPPAPAVDPLTQPMTAKLVLPAPGGKTTISDNRAPAFAAPRPANAFAGTPQVVTGTAAARLARLVDAHDGPATRNGRERAHWRQLLALIQQGLQQSAGDDGWLRQLATLLQAGGAPPGLYLPLWQALQYSRLPLTPGSARAQAIVRELRDGDYQPRSQSLLPRLQQALARLAGATPLLTAFEAASQQYPATQLEQALQLWLADAMRLLPLQGWPQRSSEALYRLRQGWRDQGTAFPAALLQAWQHRLTRLQSTAPELQALCALQRLPLLLASPMLPAHLARQIERILQDPSPALAWRRKLLRQLRLWAEGRSHIRQRHTEERSLHCLHDWQRRLATLPPSAIRDGAILACDLPLSADRQQLASALFALEKLLPPLLQHYPHFPHSPHWASQLRRLRQTLWPGRVAAWQGLAETLSLQTAHPDGIAGLWPDILHDNPALLDERIRQQPDPALKQLWQASQQSARKLRGDERRQWQQIASHLQGLIDSQQLDEDSRFWCDDAGLVLLWPFLPELFRRCDWLDEAGNWRDDFSRQQAWRALASLIGRDEDHEQGYTARVLLGLEIDEPLADLAPLATHARQHLADAVAAIEQSWASALPAMPLKGGIENLFLRRRGLWQLSQAGWQLQVEEAAQDVILSRLPWSLGLIMLPWREGLLTLNWKRPVLPAAAETTHD